MNLSLGSQEDFRPWLLQNPSKILWSYGANDSKYRVAAEEIKSLGIKTIEIPDAGHRVIFDNPKFLSQIIVELTK